MTFTVRRRGTVPGAVKVLLLVNSSASSVTPRSRVVIGKALSADHDVTVAETSRRGHATRLAQGAAGAAQALRRPPPFHFGGFRHLNPPLRPQPPPVRGAPHRRHGDRRRLFD